MFKNVVGCSLVLAVGAHQLFAADGTKLQTPPALQQRDAAAVSKPAGTLRPARIAIVEANPMVAVDVASPAKTASKRKPARRESVAEAPQQATPSSRRTAAIDNNSGDPTSNKRVTFRPVEVLPLGDPSLRVASQRNGRQAAPTDDPSPARKLDKQSLPYSVVVAQPTESATAEYYEEEPAAVVPAQDVENFAPIISAADLPRPGRPRPAGSGDAGAPPDLSVPPVNPPASRPAEQRPSAPQAAVQEEKEPARLSSVLSSRLRFPEFRARPSSQRGAEE